MHGSAVEPAARHIDLLIGQLKIAHLCLCAAGCQGGTGSGMRAVAAEYAATCQPLPAVPVFHEHGRFVQVHGVHPLPEAQAYANSRLGGVQQDVMQPLTLHRPDRLPVPAVRRDMGAAVGQVCATSVKGHAYLPHRLSETQVRQDAPASRGQHHREGPSLAAGTTPRVRSLLQDRDRTEPGAR